MVKLYISRDNEAHYLVRKTIKISSGDERQGTQTSIIVCSTSVIGGKKVNDKLMDKKKDRSTLDEEDFAFLIDHLVIVGCGDDGGGGVSHLKMLVSNGRIFTS